MSECSSSECSIKHEKVFETVKRDNELTSHLGQG